MRKRSDVFRLVTVWASDAFLNRPVSVTGVTSRAHASDRVWLISESRGCVLLVSFFFFFFFWGGGEVTKDADAFEGCAGGWSFFHPLSPSPVFCLCRVGTKDAGRCPTRELVGQSPGCVCRKRVHGTAHEDQRLKAEQVWA